MKADAVKRYGLVQDGLEQNLEEIPNGGEWVAYEDHVAALSAAEERERVMRRALEQIWKYAAHGTATKQKDARGRQFAAIHDLAIAALATPAPEPSEQKEQPK